MQISLSVNKNTFTIIFSSNIRVAVPTGCSIYFETIFIELFFLSDLFRSHEFRINLFL